MHHNESASTLAVCQSHSGSRRFTNQDARPNPGTITIELGACSRWAMSDNCRAHGGPRVPMRLDGLPPHRDNTRLPVRG